MEALRTATEPIALPPSAGSLTVAALGFVGFIAVLFVGSRLVPGPVRLGAQLRDGSRRAYRLNGLPLFLILLATVAAATAASPAALAPIATHYGSLLLVSNAFALGLTVAL